ncbi:MAG: hypothetical protein IID49_05515, partial [Proteobacteria bacterium]|nr:hypothetical protein [Pseudomonadota bacterium]
MQETIEKALSGDLGTLANIATIGGFLIVVVGIVWGIIWACLKFGRRKVTGAVKGKPSWPLICPDGINPERIV